MVSAVSAALSLRPMTDDEFAAWWDLTIAQHAQLVSNATGRPLETELDDARQLLPKVLPAGQATEGMDFFVLEDGSAIDVGWLWLGRSPNDPDAGFVWDIIIDEPFRGRGFGRAAMLAAERHFVGQGKTRVGLQVSGGNDVARTLYESLGYSTIMTEMSKRLAPDD
jgi:ribosomal protein S18 acetylase RimI-like enzyme